MKKIKLTFSYDGSKFNGSQIQPKPTKTVAGELKKAFNIVNIKADNILFSGRTDKGVHSTNQIASLEMDKYWSKNLKKLRIIVNKTLSPSIYIKKIEICGRDFHPRFLAKKRVYRYIVSDKEFNPFIANYITFVQKIDMARVKMAIKEFEGKHNFEFFKKNGSGVVNFEREIYKAKFYKYKNFYVFYFEADSFLRSQIRLMVGFLLRISDGTYNNDDLKKQLNRKKLILTKPAPPNGLYLIRIKYS